MALRDALSEREVTRLLNGVDRSSAIGRRDYAVLLLAARYGLRPSDLRRLRLVDWREGVLSITQAKTGRVLLHGSLERTIAEGLVQPAGYADRCAPRDGHLLVFDRSEGRAWEEKIFRRKENVDDRTIGVWGM